MKYWIGVVSAAHVAIGVEGAFCQFNHGKRSPLARMTAGDRFVYYSPREKIRGGDALQAFTAIGEVCTGEPYQVDLGGFKPYRRDVRYFSGGYAPIRPLLAKLSFSANTPNWGQIMRRGFFEIDADDFAQIATAMTAVLPEIGGN